MVRASSRRATEFHPLIHAAAEKSREQGVVLRNMRKRDLEAEVGRFMEVYNEAWGDNWGFVPITEAEVAFQAKNLKPVLDENWAMIAEKDGEVVGAALTLPDIEQVLAKMNGRLLPFGWWHFLRRPALHRPPARLRARRQARVPAPRRRGGALRAPRARRRPGAGPQGGHMGWILETNEPMNRAMEGMGGKVVQRYRIYRAPPAVTTAA